MATNLIIGVDSDIGNAIYKLLPNSVGTSRKDSQHIKLDVKDVDNWPTFAESFENVYYCIAVDSSADETMQVNATRSVEFLKHIAPNVTGTIRVLTSIMGALTNGNMMPANEATIHYRMSKAALNMGVMELAKQYPSVNWQLVHPGFVRTKLTKNLSYIDQATEPSFAAEKIITLPAIKGLSYIELDVTGTRLIV
jgi:NAD(P)-dependent dehydrogenase (short-subunit alcohol dehydrogenase family)